MEPGAKELAIPEELPVLTIRDGVCFPELAMPLVLTTPRSAQLVNDALSREKLVLVVAQRPQKGEEPELAEPKPAQLYRVGTVAVILRMLRFPDNTIRLMVHGLRRARVKEFIQESPYPVARLEPIPEAKPKKSIRLTALMRNLVQMFQQVVAMAPYLPEELAIGVRNIDEPGRLADFIAFYGNFELPEKQQLLETSAPEERLRLLIPLLEKELAILELEAKIRSQVKTELDRTHREYYLREQLKAIQQELGELDERTAELKELRARIGSAGMPKQVEEVALKELDRLAKIPPQAAEYAVVRTYLDWLCGMPWNVATEDNLDLRRAQQILDEDHYGLERVKERLLEYLAVRKLNPAAKSPILCFVGPPGVGKTSLGRSIARALGRKFVRFSLGGVRDEAEIRGHRRTYVGALPGRIIQGIRNAGSRNPVFMLDEVDKVGTHFTGDPASALLEVLDAEQNSTFSDHYLEVGFDLSQVMFITTANIVDSIPPPLRDRMEILELPGYTHLEKLQIARRYLIPRQVKEAGLNESKIQFTDGAIQEIIERYTREAGVRELERGCGSVIRKVARGFAEGKRGRVRVSPELVVRLLGPPRFTSEVAARSPQIGVATGLSWTPSGGEVLFVEVQEMPGQKGLLLTGSLGDVMKESAHAALSFIRAHARELRLNPHFFETHDIHIHVPYGGVPKDGPSAGIAIVTALYSRLRRLPVDPSIAMTGEITLSGRILRVGGIKEKVLGAKRAGITQIIMPQENRNDLIEVPEEAKQGLKFHFVSRVEDVLRLLFDRKGPNRGDSS